MKIRINKIHYPVTALGPGRRVGIWFQGCSLCCRGCISRDTWDSAAAPDVSVTDVIEWISARAPDGFDGITISGGEPFEQPEALEALLRSLQDYRSKRGSFDILAYSGFSSRLLKRRFPQILARLDAVISGPFVASRADDLLWRGSSNQEILALTVRGRGLYGPARSGTAPTRKPVQLSVEQGSVFYIGVPRPGDMERVEEAARRRGVELGGASWRA